MTTYLDIFYVNATLFFFFYCINCAEVDLLQLSNEPLK